ncbi:ensconsin isoform X3 [Gouania willdenowi]|uniref:ensconsin isoform X3 n=1 Tax=Gouania willdenowi TaxID=441366 RepID=UPI0010544F25|nr:ensconsin isoform X3 [Gouania willdenowi]
MPKSKGHKERRGGCTQEVKLRLRKAGSRTAIPVLFTITEEDEGQRRRDAQRKKRVSTSQYKSEDGRVSSATRPSSSGSTHTYTPTLTPTPVPTINRIINSDGNNAAAKADSLLFNKMDERQRLARERREEHEKLNAVKEAQWQAREERAKQHYEKHLEERRRKLEEQRVKEDKRRAAVEDKRRQKLDEDRARHEAVIRRTSDRTQKPRPKANRWSWGGAQYTNTPSTPADADRRSLSTMNLSKHTDPVITKRLSSSSATLLHSPDRGLRRLPLTPWESNMVNRLQQPTHSHLARSRSAMSLSGDQTAMPVCPRSVSCQPGGSMSFKAIQAQPFPHCRNQERSLSRETPSSTSVVLRRKTTGTPRIKERDNVRKSWSNLSLPMPPLLSLPPTRRSTSPVKKSSKGTAPSAGRLPLKAIDRPPTPKLLKLSRTDDPGNVRPAKFTSQSPNTEQVLSPPLPRPQPLGQNKSSTEKPTAGAESNENGRSSPAQKATAGTTDPEEASRILAEKRRLAREQREREEEEQKHQEEQARLAKEEMARRKAEERAKREEEAQRQAEERMRKEEEEKKAEEERLENERDELQRLQKLKEEEESRQQEEVERLRQEREKHFQKEEAERLERKKRLEEIMKRTRRSDATEKKVQNGDGAETSAATPEKTLSLTLSSNGSSKPDSSSHLSITTAQRENGEFEEVILLPSHSRLSPPEGEEQQQPQQDGEGRTPFVAFTENGLKKPLSGIDEISAQQRPDVA